MGNWLCRDNDEDAWKQQNKEMEVNPAFTFADLGKGGKLIEAYNNHGPKKVVEIARNEMSTFFYHSDGRSHEIKPLEFINWQHSRRISNGIGRKFLTDEELEKRHKTDYFNKIYSHYACWDLSKRGGVGETPFHILYLMDSPVHFEVAKTLLGVYPNLALDVYEGEEYYGESALHIAIVVGDIESVHMLVKSGANVNQRATGRFFLPEDQKQGYTGTTNYDGYAYYGEYPLSFAACMGNVDMYDFLLENGADPNLQDSFGNTVLHMVVISDEPDMYKYAVRHHRKKANTNIKNNQGLTPLTLACRLGRHGIFKEMMDLDRIEFWRFSTTMCSAYPLNTIDSIGPDGKTNWTSALMIIVNGEKDEHLEMLQGGVMRQLLDEKWKTFARKRFIIRLVMAALHLIMFSVALYTRPSGNELFGYRGASDAIRYTTEVYVCFSCFGTVLFEIKEIVFQGLSSFLKNCMHAPAQTVNLVSCLLVLICIPFRLVGLHNVEDILLIIAAPGTWFFLLFFAREYKLTGPFVTMIYKMLHGDLLRFGIIYVIFLVGFTQGFYFLYRHIENSDSNADVQKFATFPETVLTLFQMTLGEFKYEAFDSSHYSALTKLIFAVFMILVPILLLNMLIAMMGNTYTQVIAKSEKEWRKQWAKIVVVLERGVSDKKRQEYQKSYSVKLSGGPPADDDSEGSRIVPEERALVVIKTTEKSRAKTRKSAIFHWKLLGKEVVRQIRVSKKSGTWSEFELTESNRIKMTQRLQDDLGEAQDEEDFPQLSNTVAQLAWQKDIDLTKGQTLLADPDAISMSPTLTARNSPLRKSSSSHRPSLTDAIEQLAWEKDIDLTKGKTFTKDISHITPKTLTTDLSKAAIDSKTVKPKQSRGLVYSRVPPLNESPKSDSTFFDLFEVGSKKTKTRQKESIDKGEKVISSPERNVVISRDPKYPVIQSEFSLSAESSTLSDANISRSAKHRRKSTQSRPGSSDSRKHPEPLTLASVENANEVSMFSSERHLDLSEKKKSED